MEENLKDLSLYIRNPDVVLREEDEDGGLLFNPDTNQIKVINPSGLLIWQMCDGTKLIPDIKKSIVESFENVPSDKVEKEIMDFLKEMVTTGFIGVLEKEKNE